jgi:ribosome-associated protein
MSVAISVAMGATIEPSEVDFIAIRAQGPGGQNVNKVSCAVHARFDIGASSLPPEIKERLLARHDGRITREGVVVIKAQESRSLERNKEDALRRLQELVDQAGVVAKARKATRPTKGSQQAAGGQQGAGGEDQGLAGEGGRLNMLGLISYL